MSEPTVDLNELENDDLVGYFMLAGIERRFEQHRALGAECVRRGLFPEGAPQELEQEIRDQQKPA